MHAATSAMFRGTSLPRHLRSGAESSGSVQNPLLRGRSSNHSEPSVDTSYQPSHHSQLPPAALSVTTCSKTPSVVHASQSVDLSVVMQELSAMRKEMKQAIAHLAAIAYLTSQLKRVRSSPYIKISVTLTCCYGQNNRLLRACKPSRINMHLTSGTNHVISYTIPYVTFYRCTYGL